MNDCDKPFPCGDDNCKMTFTNEDHLNVHKRKHDMALHLGINSPDSNTADQTPTPTRFIRNCEEVGLFQDLQNLNPFDETFRKAATDLAKHGSLQIPPTTSNDESLHTPHIFPHIDQNDKYPTNSEDDFSVNDLVIDEGDTDLHCVPINNQCSSASNQTTLEDKNLDNCGSVCNLVRPQPGSNAVTQTNASRKSKSKHLVQVQKQRELNRFAQKRTRAKKKMLFHKLSEEVSLLKCETKELAKENQRLRLEIIWARTMLLYHKDCPASKDPQILKKISSLTKATHEKLKLKTLQHPTGTTLVPIQLSPLVIAPTQSPQLGTLQPITNSILLQVQGPLNTTIAPSNTKLLPLLPKPTIYTASPILPTKQNGINSVCISTPDQIDLNPVSRSQPKNNSKHLNNNKHKLDKVNKKK